MCHGHVVQTCDREVMGSIPTRGCYVPMPTQCAIPLQLANEYQQKLGTKRHTMR